MTKNINQQIMIDKLIQYINKIVNIKNMIIYPYKM